MPKPIDPQLREAILADIKAGTMSCRGIARKHGVSPATVTKLGSAIPGAFERSRTAKCTRARQFDAKAARAQLVQDLLEDAQRLRRERIWAPYTQVVPSAAGPELVTTKLPPLRDQQAGFTSVAICIDKAVKLTDVDAGDGAAGARSLLGRLGEALSVAAESFAAEPDPAPDHGDVT